MRSQVSSSTLTERVERHQVVIVDLRTPLEFAQGHPKGAISLPFSARGLAERLTAVVDPGTPIRLVASEPAVASAG